MSAEPSKSVTSPSPNPMKTAVIHRPERLDRCQNIAALHKLFPNLSLIHAQVPAWESDRMAMAVRGCSLSHLLGVRHLLSDANLIIFEDDAVPFDRGIEIWNRANPRIPEDAGVVLLGGETEQVSGSGMFRRVCGRFWGTHAVLHTPALAKSSFLLNAYEILASHPIGVANGPQTGLCYESVLLMAVERAGLKVYRPETMLFTTSDSASDRTGAMMPSRTRSLSLPRHRIHQFWTGGEMPPAVSALCSTVRDKNPDLDYTLWNLESAKDALAEYPGYAECLRIAGGNPTKIADATRWFLLHKFGGWWLDTDFEVVKPISSWPIPSAGFVSACEDARGKVATGLMYSEPGGVVVTAAVSQIPARMARYTGPKELSLAAGPEFLTELLNTEPHGLIPHQLVYPFPWDAAAKTLAGPRSAVVNADTLAVHYWWGGWTEDGLSSNTPEAILKFLGKAEA